MVDWLAGGLVRVYAWSVGAAFAGLLLVMLVRTVADEVRAWRRSRARTPGHAGARPHAGHRETGGG